MPRIFLLSVALELNRTINPKYAKLEKILMIFNCCRCPKHGILRRGSVTGNRVAAYIQHETEINGSGILTLNRSSLGKPLCPECIVDLLDWIKEKKNHTRK